MDGHNLGLYLVAILVGNDAVDAAVIHVGLHGVSVSGSLVAGRFEILHVTFLVVPLIGQIIALHCGFDAELLALGIKHIRRLLQNLQFHRRQRNGSL